MTRTPTKTPAARKSSKAPGKHTPSAADQALLDAQLEKGLTPTPEEQEDQETNLPALREGFDLAASCGGGAPIETQTSEVVAMLFLGHTNYEGYDPKVGIHISLGNRACKPNPAEHPNQLEDLRFEGIAYKRLPDYVNPHTGEAKEVWKLNLFVRTRDNKVLMGTCGLTTATSKGIISGLRWLVDNDCINAVFNYSVKPGNIPMSWLSSISFPGNDRSLFDGELSRRIKESDDQLQFIKDEIDSLARARNGVQKVTVLEQLRETPALAAADSQSTDEADA